MPPKLYHGPEEPPYGDEDKRINKAIAQWLFNDQMGGKPGATLDVGARYPYLAHCFAELGCDAYAIDGEFEAHEGLKAKTIAGDFEAWDGDGKFRLISLIHVFEHLYDPLAAIRKLRRLITDDGRVYIRLPDHEVPGFDRDLTEHHYMIHPYFHCLSSILELLARAGDAFTVQSYAPLQPGQCDIILRPIKKAPTIGLGMIVKNEERDLPRLLKSVETVIDGGVVIDTGSTDNTGHIVKSICLGAIAFRRFLGASEKIDGDWKLINFAKARNEYVNAMRRARFDWLLWMDADDELLTPLAVNRARYMPPSVLGMWIELGGGLRQVHYRMWPTSQPITFKGWVHEYPVLPPGFPSPVLNDVCIRHDATPHGSETSNARNLRIMERQWEAEPDARCAFYLANTHKDGRRHKEAIEWYHKRLGYGKDFREEYLFALLYLARELMADGQEQAGRDACEVGLAEAPDWQEFRMELAQSDYRAKDYDGAIVNALLAFDRPQPVTVLWREPDKYADQPARLISWCHQDQKHFAEALLWSEIAANRIGVPDPQWEMRHRQLIGMRDAERNAPAIVKRLRRKVALVRPGAIGDILMTLNLLPAFIEANPDTDVHYFSAFSDQEALGGIIAQAGAVPMDVAGLNAWRKDYDKVINLVGYPLAEGYPEKPMRQHLLEYFAAEMGVVTGGDLIRKADGADAPYFGLIKPDDGFVMRPKLPALELPLPRRPKAAPSATDPYMTIQYAAGWSKYKEWKVGRWLQFDDAMEAHNIKVCAIDESRGRSLAESIALIANAHIHVGVDSFGNHLTNYFWKNGNAARRVPGVILWGSTQMEAAGYPTNINIGHRLPCGPCFRENPAISQMPRGLCVDPPGQTRHDEGVHACMAAITVDEVVAAALKLWESAK
jgi:ADP-heptose:LPS heptosyltransferase/glycosyltransferase involved in cell wall biosynthesis